MFTINFNFENIPCTATVVEGEKAYEEVYAVTLDDGYQNNFFIPIDAGQWCEEGIGFTDLAQSIGAAIRQYQLNQYELKYKHLNN